MKVLVDYWYIILAFAALVALIVYGIYAFAKKPTNEQIESLKQWLLYAVIEAEKQLGSGTGQVKLRYVYDMFVSKFPSLAKIIPFATFSMLVDEALVKMRGLLEDGSPTYNKAIRDYVIPKEAEA